MNQIVNNFITNFPIDRREDSLTKNYSKELFSDLGYFLVDNHIPFALYFIDFDNFKKVNDTLGHAYGDRALIDATNMIKESIDEDCLLFRIGGDEFAIIIPDIQDRQTVWDIAHKYSEYVRKTNIDYLKEVYPKGNISFTTGIARYPFDTNNFQELLKIADKALYRGKFKGKNCFIIYDKDLHGNIDTHNRSLKLSQAGLITYMFETFNKETNLDKALTFVCKMLGKYYNDSIVCYHSKTRHELLYIDKDDKDINYQPYEECDFYFEDNERFKYFYKYDVNKNEEQHALAKLMKLTHTRSLLVFRLINQKKEIGYLAIYARRDKIWSDEEFDTYLTLSLLYSTINHYFDK